MNRARYLLLLSALASFGISAPTIRYAVALPIVIVGWRATMAFVPLAMVSIARKQRWPLSLGIPGGLLLAGYWVLWVSAVQRTSIAHATLLLSTGSLWATLLSRPVLGEPIPPRQWLGLGLALSGVATFVLTKHSAPGDGTLAGDLYALGGSMCWVLYTFVGRRARSEAGVWGYAAATHATAAVAVFTWAVFTGATVFALSGTTWIAIAVLAVFPTMLGQTALNYLLRYVGPARLNLCLLSKPIIASALAWLVFREAPTGWVCLGGALTLMGVGLGLAPSISWRGWSRRLGRWGDQKQRVGNQTAT